MLFSGTVRVYQCESCKSEYSDILPTSILPLGATIILASFAWGQVLRKFIDIRWVSVGMGVVIAIATFGIIYWIIDVITTRKIRGGYCPKCGETLKITSSGFYDTIIPQPWELAIYAIVVAVPVVAYLATPCP